MRCGVYFLFPNNPPTSSLLAQRNATRSRTKLLRRFRKSLLDVEGLIFSRGLCVFAKGNYRSKDVWDFDRTYVCWLESLQEDRIPASESCTYPWAIQVNTAYLSKTDKRQYFGLHNIDVFSSLKGVFDSLVFIQIQATSATRCPWAWFSMPWVCGSALQLKNPFHRMPLLIIYALSEVYWTSALLSGDRDPHYWYFLEVGIYSIQYIVRSLI